MRGRSVGTSVRGCTSPKPKAPIALVILFVLIFLVISTRIFNFEREVSVCPLGPKSVLFHLAKFLLEALQRRIQDFKLGGGTLKKIVPSRGRREHFWGILCEKSRFHANNFPPPNFRGARAGCTPLDLPLPWVWQLIMGVHQKTELDNRKIRDLYCYRFTTGTRVHSVIFLIFIKIEYFPF